jgi:outer membrane protein assembly factor BamB
LIRWRITRERETYLPGVEFNYYWPVWTDGKLVYWYSDLHDDLSALDPNTGELRWRFNLTEELKAFAFDGEKCFIVTSSRVYALDKSSGQIKWVYVHAGFRMVYGTATLVNNLLYVSTEDEIIGLDVTTGTPVWSFPAQGGAMVDVADNIAYLCTSEYVLAVKIK